MIAHLLNRTATQKRATKASDGRGGFNRSSMSDIETALPVRVQVAGASERVTAQTKDGAVVTHIGYALPDALIVRGDMLHMNDGAEVFEVLAAGRPSVAAHHQKLFLEEKQTHG